MSRHDTLDFMEQRLIVGIDEAGRGPLAGPLVVAAVSGFNKKTLKGIKDSKKLSPKKRQEWYKTLKESGTCRFTSVSASYIDRYGIARSVRTAVARLLQRYPKKPTFVLLDGSMDAPVQYRQRTIIRGDQTVPLISAASIVAKVVRDRKMGRLHFKYPLYHLHIHKGYGTKKHIHAIRKHGLSAVHRRSFCTGISFNHLLT